MLEHVTRIVAALALLVVVAGGCSPKSSGTKVACSPPECATDSTLLLVAEVDPPADAQLVRQEFAAITIDPQTGMFALDMLPQVTLSGTVVMGSGTTAKPVAATVVATRPSRIVGRPDVVYQATVNPLDGTYKLVVSSTLVGEKYAVRVTTTDLSLEPPKTMMVEADADERLDVAFDAPLTLPELHGTILDSLQQPVPGMQVQASTVATATTPSVVLSTTTVTDANGAYSIRLSPTLPDKVTLTATPTMLAADDLPTLARTVDTSKLGPTSALTAGLTVPPLPAPVNVSYNVTGTGTSGATMAVTAATCVFTADVSDPHATDGTAAIHQATAMTDPLTGAVNVALIPTASGNRSYVVTVTPDATQPFATKTTTVSVGAAGYGPDIVLALRAQLSGRVLDPEGQPLHNLMVVPAAATLAATLGPTAFSVSTTPQQANAGSDGRFSLRVDEGVWDVGLVPPAGALLPRLWLTQLDLDADLDVGTVVVPKGVMVHGVVHDPTGGALAHANVRIYTIPSGNANCAPTDEQCLAPPRLRAEGSSGTDGVVALILPSPPQQ
jgi:hypothetical protein